MSATNLAYDDVTDLRMCLLTGCFTDRSNAHSLSTIEGRNNVVDAQTRTQTGSGKHVRRDACSMHELCSAFLTDVSPLTLVRRQQSRVIVFPPNAVSSASKRNYSFWHLYSLPTKLPCPFTGDPPWKSKSDCKSANRYNGVSLVQRLR